MIAAVIHSANSMTVVLGVFESQELAEQAFLSRGCKWMSLRERYPNTDWSRNPARVDKKHLFFTKEFGDWMSNSRDLPWYTVSGDMDEIWVDFEEIQLNEISFGFDDD